MKVWSLAAIHTWPLQTLWIILLLYRRAPVHTRASSFFSNFFDVILYIFFFFKLLFCFLVIASCFCVVLGVPLHYYWLSSHSYFLPSCIIGSCLHVELLLFAFVWLFFAFMLLLIAIVLLLVAFVLLFFVFRLFLARLFLAFKLWKSP